MVQWKPRIVLGVTLIALICGGLLLWLFGSLRNQHPSEITIQNGQVDLSGWTQQSILPLSGEWDFYWKKFLDVQNFQDAPPPDLEVSVPSIWNTYQINGEPLGGMGFATYRLHVTGVTAGDALALRIMPFLTAYTLYVDQQPIASSGQVSTSEEGFLPQYRIQTVFFTPQSDSFDITLHIANFAHARGGFCYNICLGTPQTIQDLNDVSYGVDFFILGSLLVISLVCLVLFLVWNERFFLLFFIICMIMLVRTLIDGNYLINNILPNISFHTVIWIDYITVYWLPGVCLQLIHTMYPDDIPKGTTLFGYAMIMTGIALFLPMRIFTGLIYVSETVAIGACIYGITKTVQLVLHRKREAAFVLMGELVLTLCVLHDVLFGWSLLKTGYKEYFPVAFLVMAFLIECAFLIRYFRKTEENKRILQDLYLAKHREQLLELQFLKSQIRPHFINNALNAIISISRRNPEESRRLLMEFSRYLQSFYAVENLADKIPIEHELMHVRAYVALEQARFQEDLCVLYDVQERFMMLPPLTLQPLVENAIVHGVLEKPGKGHVLIYVKEDGDYMRIGVTDDGIGMPSELIENLLSEKHISHGVGIYNINQRMQKLYHTRLHLERCPEGGTNAYILVPTKDAPRQI